MKKEFTCIVCPNGCNLTVEKNGEEIKVSGNTCKRGEDFGKKEVTHPERTICSTVKTIFKETPVISVRVSSDIPKEMIFPVMDEINKVTLDERLEIGSVVIPNVLNLGVDVILTSNKLMEG